MARALEPADDARLLDRGAIQLGLPRDLAAGMRALGVERDQATAAANLLDVAFAGLQVQEPETAIRDEDGLAPRRGNLLLRDRDLAAEAADGDGWGRDTPTSSAGRKDAASSSQQKG